MASNRILKSTQGLAEESPTSCNAGPIAEDLFHWQAIIMGSPDSPYAEVYFLSLFMFLIIIPLNLPRSLLGLRSVDEEQLEAAGFHRSSRRMHLLDSLDAHQLRVAVSWVVDVDEKKGKSLFYYVAEVDGHPGKKPLTRWFDGDFREKKTTFKLG
ncbi:Ubiquitin-conjugating enzyme, E2 [Cinnamomum micranthum f. kanehirae]|uniref:Ubiquitin-conjugating enzyme, E2 n=1 Tax=Cinnamomum micranthum f. kanehirae TaxID=337451 RepID=A0A3S3MXX7_9MAGN|nr:Ubiquitin-conjugating enzyme, E2 [Cinnamomum micranthum f. kanehirae]